MANVVIIRPWNGQPDRRKELFFYSLRRPPPFFIAWRVRNKRDVGGPNSLRRQRRAAVSRSSANCADFWVGWIRRFSINDDRHCYLRGWCIGEWPRKQHEYSTGAELQQEQPCEGEMLYENELRFHWFLFSFGGWGERGHTLLERCNRNRKLNSQAWIIIYNWPLALFNRRDRHQLDN